MSKALKKDKFSTWIQKICFLLTDSQNHKVQDPKDLPEALEEHLEEEAEVALEVDLLEADLLKEVEVVAEDHSTELQANSNVDIHMSYW